MVKNTSWQVNSSSSLKVNGKLVRKRTVRTAWRGAGLIEYALILMLVAVSAIFVLSLVGLGVQRLFGLTTAVLGTKANATGAEVIHINGANCYVIAKGSSYAGGIYAATGYTGYFLKVDSNVPLDQMNSAGTELTVMMNIFTPQTTIVPPPG